jgi:hypothetical protein
MSKLHNRFPSSIHLNSFTSPNVSGELMACGKCLKVLPNAGSGGGGGSDDYVHHFVFPWISFFTTRHLMMAGMAETIVVLPRH